MVEHIKICLICRKNIAENACLNCGSLVCDRCFSTKRGLCVSCIAGKT